MSQGHTDWTQSSCFASFSQPCYVEPNRSSHKSTEDTEPELTQCQNLDPQQGHSPRVPSKGSRAGLWWPQGSPEVSRVSQEAKSARKDQQGTWQGTGIPTAQLRPEPGVWADKHLLIPFIWFEFCGLIDSPIFASCKYLDTPTLKTFSFEILNLSKEQTPSWYIHVAFNSLISLLVKGTQNWAIEPKPSILLSWTTPWDQHKHPLTARGQTSAHRKLTCVLPAHLLLTFLSDIQQGNWHKRCPLYISMHFGGNWTVFKSPFEILLLL